MKYHKGPWILFIVIYICFQEHPRNLIPELCRLFYNLGWVTGTGGGISIKHEYVIKIFVSLFTYATLTISMDCLNGMVLNYAKGWVYLYFYKWLYTIFGLRFLAPEKCYIRDRFLLLPGSTKDGFCCFIIIEVVYLCSSNVMHYNILWQRQNIHCSIWCSEGTYITRGSVCTGHWGTGFGTTSTREKAEEESVHTTIYVCLHR
jgi:hypothetical protein